jgi:carboxyl-terminal processing protease
MALPAISLTCPTSGNAMNNPVGAVLVPSVTNVFLSDVESPGLGATATAEVLGALAETLAPRPIDAHLVGDVGYLRIERFVASTPAAFYHAVVGLRRGGVRRLVLDLRGCPGGEIGAAIELAGDFLEATTLVATLVDVDDDATEYRSAERLYDEQLTLVVDGATASAAELFAGALRVHRRAVIAGARTYGKATAQAMVSRENRPIYGSVGRFLLPDGTDIGGGGIAPDLSLAVAADANAEAVVAALVAQGADRTSL